MSEQAWIKKRRLDVSEKARGSKLSLGDIEAQAATLAGTHRLPQVELKMDKLAGP
jgi:hypothetical protein